MSTKPSPSEQLKEHIQSADTTVEQLGRFLDDLDEEQRTLACAGLSSRSLAQFFEKAEGARETTLDFVAPARARNGELVVHRGRNSLPMFRSFSKVFYKGTNQDSGRVWGYNATSSVVRAFAGPGYFVVQPKGKELLIDYEEIPSAPPPPNLPKVVPNTRGTARFVFGGLTDVLRGVSSHVSIGRGAKKGAFVDAWFVLCRQKDKS